MIFLTIIRNPFDYIRENENAYWNSLTSNENIQYVLNKFTEIYNFLIVRPLARLYLYGPRFGGYGFWQGMTDTDICTALNSGHNPSSFWSKNLPECHEMIARDFNAWLVFVEFLVTLLVLYMTCKYLKRFGKTVWSGIHSFGAWMSGKLNQYLKHNDRNIDNNDSDDINVNTKKK